jgi:hypothetical protein
MRHSPLLVLALAFVALARDAAAQGKVYTLESTKGLRPLNAVMQPATLAQRKGLRVTPVPGTADGECLVVIDGADFSNGVIEAEIAGAPGAEPLQGARGFVGIAFRVQPDLKTYDAFYLRPTNGRADDQERRNHATQYISHPDWTWNRLRTETPSKYESYVDVQPGVWTKIRIEVTGDHARLFVHDRQQPVLIVNEVKSGANGKGGVALWIGPGTVAHFRKLTVTASR